MRRWDRPEPIASLVFSTVCSLAIIGVGIYIIPLQIADIREAKKRHAEFDLALKRFDENLAKYDEKLARYHRMSDSLDTVRRERRRQMGLPDRR